MARNEQYIAQNMNPGSQEESGLGNSPWGELVQDSSAMETNLLTKYGDETL